MRYMAAVIVLFAVLVMGRGAYVLIPGMLAHAYSGEVPGERASSRHAAAARDDTERRVQEQIRDIQARIASSPATAVVLAQPGAEVVPVVPADVHQYQLNLVYYSGDYRRAVIDDALLAEGDHLPSGGRVLSIREDRVIVRDHQGRHTLVVPAARLRIGAVRTVARDQDEKAGQP